ncbi:MAG: glutathione S-transferase family protein [Alphaproteobacteria bacterium]|nr:MAG: glutathione S-transferase family protein [Alphaproteobacteria bacterium]
MLLIGSHVSPYARKAIFALEMKGIDYAVDPITPFLGNDEFSRLSPLRRIPVLIHGDLVLNDSSAICEYLDEMYPDPPLMPATAAERARARWLEEYADTRLGDLTIWGLFYQRVVAPRVRKRATDEDRVARVIARELPEALDWIEVQAPAERFLFDHICTADATFAAFFRNAAIAGFTVDPARWPRTAAWLARVEAVPAFARTIIYEQALIAVPAKERREALRAAGAKLSEKTYGETEPRASIMLD